LLFLKLAVPSHHPKKENNEQNKNRYLNGICPKPFEHLYEHFQQYKKQKQDEQKPENFL